MECAAALSSAGIIGSQFTGFFHLMKHLEAKHILYWCKAGNALSVKLRHEFASGTYRNKED
jgi:hypothetical protein